MTQPQTSAARTPPTDLDKALPRNQGTAEGQAATRWHSPSFPRTLNTRYPYGQVDRRSTHHSPTDLTYSSLKLTPLASHGALPRTLLLAGEAGLSEGPQDHSNIHSIRERADRRPIRTSPQFVRSNTQPDQLRPTIQMNVLPGQPPVTIQHQRSPTPANIENDNLENRRGSRHRGFKSHTHRRFSASPFSAFDSACRLSADPKGRLRALRAARTAHEWLLCGRRPRPPRWMVDLVRGPPL